MAADDAVELSEQFAGIARALLAEHEVEATLDRIVRAAVELIDGAESASLSIVRKRQVHTEASTDDVPRRADRIQYEVDQGPCLDAIREHEVFRTDDLSEEERWPAFARRAHEETGMRSMLSLRLFAEEDTMGALNIYSSQRAAFDRRGEAIGSVLAAHAAVAMSTASEIAGLQEALTSRPVIEQAKGIIMSATGCSADEAFDLLREQSQTLNQKLRDVAADLVARQRYRD